MIMSKAEEYVTDYILAQITTKCKMAEIGSEMYMSKILILRNTPATWDPRDSK